MNSIDDSQNTAPGRLLGIIDRRLRERMRSELHELGLRRGSWQLLHRLADGPATTDELSAALPGGRRHGGPRGERPDEHEHDHGPHEHGHEHHDHHGRSRLGTPEEREAFFEKRRSAFEGRFGTPEEREAFFEKRRSAFEGRFGTQEEREAFFEKRHPEFAERFPTPAEREAFRAGMHATLGFGPRDRGGWRNRAEGAPSGERGHEHGGERHEHGRRGPRGARVDRTLRDFAERGWVREDDGVVALTDEGREAHDRAFSRIRDLRGSVRAGVSDEDYATTIATLEAMARNLGWERPTGS